MVIRSTDNLVENRLVEILKNALIQRDFAKDFRNT